MNLLDKKKILRNIIKPGFIFLIPVFFGCDRQNDLGIKYDLGSSASVKFTEIPLAANNIYIDSLRTDGSLLLLGNFADDLTGTVHAEPYFQLTYISNSVPNNEFQSHYILDSVWISGEAQKATSDDYMQAFEIYSFEDGIPAGIYLNTYSKNHNFLISKIGEGSFSGQKHTDTLIFSAPLSSEFGRELVETGKTEGTTLSALEWPAIGFIPTETSNTISLLSSGNDTTRLYLSVLDTMYMKIVGNDTLFIDTTYTAQFQLSGRYSYVERDFSNIGKADLAQYEDFELPDNQLVIDPLAGFTISIDISSIQQFIDTTSNIIINNADIVFEVKNEESRDLLDGMRLYFRKEDGRIFGPASESGVEQFRKVVMSSYATNGASALETRPSSDSTLMDSTLLISPTIFFQELYNETNKTGILGIRDIFDTNNTIPVSKLVMVNRPSNRITLNRTIFKADRIKLRIYYTEVEQ